MTITPTPVLDEEEVQVLKEFSFAGNSMWISEAKDIFFGRGDVIQRLSDRKLVAFDWLMIQVTDAGREALENS